jgi:hypothetical protein
MCLLIYVFFLNRSPHTGVSIGLETTQSNGTSILAIWSFGFSQKKELRDMKGLTRGVILSLNPA